MLESLLLTQRPGTTEPESAEDGVWEGLRVLDLYAGTGGLGIEALSRGAAWADFVEQNRATCRIVAENLRLTGLADRAAVHCRPVAAYIRDSQQAVPYDIILLDPPYADAGLAETLRLLADTGLAQSNALLMAEHAHRAPLPEDIPCATGRLDAVRVRRHGDTTISIYRYTKEM